MLDTKDGGIGSRKLWLVVGACLLLTGCWLMTGWVVPLQPTLDTIVGGVMGLVGLYLTGNVSSRWITAKSMANVSFQGEVTTATATTTTTPTKPTTTTTTVQKVVVAPNAPKSDKPDDGVTEEGG